MDPFSITFFSYSVGKKCIPLESRKRDRIVIISCMLLPCMDDNHVRVQVVGYLLECLFPYKLPTNNIGNNMPKKRLYSTLFSDMLLFYFQRVINVAEHSIMEPLPAIQSSTLQ